MKLEMKTAKLQEMVARSIKGASNNKLIPITNLLGIQLEDKTLTLITTDATNYLYVREEDIEGEDFSVVVYADQFSKLISKLTCEYVSLEIKQNALEVIGNGNYLIDLPLDENGEFIKYPDPYKDFEPVGDTVDIYTESVKSILTTLKPALAVTLDNPCYTAYYVGNGVVATDTFKIARLNETMWDVPRLISAEMMDLLSVMESKKITVAFNENAIVFDTIDCTVYGNVMTGIDDYSIDAITELVDMEYDSICKVSKNEMLQVLDRLALFVGTYDKNGIYLTFTKDGLQISSKASNGVEVVEYIEGKNQKNFTCCIDIEMLASQIKAQVSDSIEIQYGLDNAIKMVDGDVTLITALLEDDRVQD